MERLAEDSTVKKTAWRFPGQNLENQENDGEGLYSRVCRTTGWQTKGGESQLKNYGDMLQSFSPKRPALKLKINK